MKKITLFLSMMMAVVAWAQMPQIQFSKVGKGLDFASMMNGTILDKSTEGVLAVVPGTFTVLGGSAINGKYYLRMVDAEGKALREVVLPGLDDRKVIGVVLPTTITASYVDGKAYLIYKAKENVLRTVIDASTMKVIESKPIQEVKNSKVFFVQNAVSPNRDFYVVGFSGDKDNGRMMLLDETLQPLWEENVTPRNWISVDNKGNVYNCGYRVNSNGVTHLDVTYYEAGGEVVDEKTSFPYAMNVEFISGDNGVVVAMGMVACNEQNKKDKYVTYDRLAGISYDFNDHRSHINVSDMTSDEFNVLFNLATKKPNKEGRVDGLVVRNKMATSFGGVAVVGRQWNVTVRQSNGMSSTTYYNVGSLVLAVDKNANILWHLPIRSFTEEGVDDQAFSKPHLFECGDKIYFMQVEKSGTETYDIAKAVKKFNPGSSHGTHGLYGIDRQGNVSKSILKLNGCIFGEPYRISDHSMILFQGLTKGGFAEVTL